MLRREPTFAGKNDRGAKLRATWEATGKAAPFVVAELTTDVTLVGGTLPDPGGAGGSPQGGGAGRRAQATTLSPRCCTATPWRNCGRHGGMCPESPP
ncbi:hypothetical protein [Sorangium sp. So ce385]|uniref:hypothetical protein n=1 Tax=Sorangium sp. So ce385 TaxID=3133308 RepID=UPI003F5B1DF6